MYKRLGVMLDCSRGGVMKVSAVKSMIDCLCKIGYNTLMLYTEDTFEVDGEPYFGYMRGRYTCEELREIDGYAVSKGIELIPCIQTLAHFTNLVKLPRYAPITDIADILLCGDERVYELIERVFNTLKECFSSRTVHIGMDEAHLVGLGKFLDKHGYVNRYDILKKHLSAVTDIAESRGFKPIIWSDMLFRLYNNGEYYGKNTELPPEAKETVNKKTGLVYWDYYHTDAADYDAMFAAHFKTDNKVWFAGGAWTWVGFAPLAEFTRVSMRAAMESVRRNNVENIFITMWGDNGNECSRFSLLQVLYGIKRYADGIADEEKISTEFDKLFGVKSSDFDLLSLPNMRYEGDCEIANPAKALLFSDAFTGVFDYTLNKSERIAYGEYALKLSKAAARAGKFKPLFTCAEKLCRALNVKAYLGVDTRAAYKEGKPALKKLLPRYDEAAKRILEFYEEFGKVWTGENKPFGLEVHDARFGGLIMRLKSCRNRISDYLEGKIDCIEELEQELLPFNPDCEKDTVLYNDYRRIISFGEL